ncbi:right-handed parallel beta-helix repeat-containing protein [Candidatus Bipolaricaulota bacterium]|nr:right-handed parallel beta-helix repeat-containing protein [Candidatus Bipolaricaulota bacterium]
MKRGIAVGLSVILMLGLSVGSLAADREVIFVSAESGSGTIQQAIDAANAGDIVIVQAGLYTENVVIEKPITLIGREGAILSPSVPEAPAIFIDAADDVFVRGIEIIEAGCGILPLNSSCNISDCTITATEMGIAIHLTDASSAVHIASCRTYDSGSGILVSGNGSVSISQCQMRRHGVGIFIAGYGTTTVSQCSIATCFEGIVTSTAEKVVLVANEIHHNDGRGIRLEVPSSNGSEPSTEAVDYEGYLAMFDNLIEDNGQWAMTLCGINGVDSDVVFGTFMGSGNSFTGNGNGPTCPDNLTFPEGFLKEESDT